MRSKPLIALLWAVWDVAYRQELRACGFTHTQNISCLNYRLSMCYHKITWYASMKWVLQFTSTVLIKLPSFPQSLMSECTPFPYKTVLCLLINIQGTTFFFSHTSGSPCTTWKPRASFPCLERVKNLELERAKQRALRHAKSVLHPRFPAERELLRWLGENLGPQATKTER